MSLLYLLVGHSWPITNPPWIIQQTIVNRLHFLEQFKKTNKSNNMKLIRPKFLVK